MSYPQQENLKNLIERVASLESQRYVPHPVTQTMLTGVVKDIVTGSPGLSCSTTYLQVINLIRTTDSDGLTHFLDKGDNPLKNGDTDGPKTRWDRVVANNVPPEYLGLYFHEGQIVSYWVDSGETDDDNTPSQSYVTSVADLSFFAEVEVDCICDHSNSSTGGGGASGEAGSGSSAHCPTHGEPYLGRTQWAYKFKAQQLDASKTSIDTKVADYTCGDSGENSLTGRCWNLTEKYNTGGKTGTGILVDQSDGTRLDDDSDQKIIPVGKHVTRVTPVVSYDNGKCAFTDYWFSSMNSFADQPNDFKHCCSSSSSSSSSQSSSSSSQSSSSSKSHSSSSNSSNSNSSSDGRKRCVWQYMSTYTCGSGWSEVSLFNVQCMYAPGNLAWQLSSSFDGGCIYIKYVVTDVCEGEVYTTAGCIEPTAPTAPTFIPACCGSSESGSHGSTSHAASISHHASGSTGGGGGGSHPSTGSLSRKRCVWQFTSTYTCGSGWSNVELYNIQCEYAPANLAWQLSSSYEGGCVYVKFVVTDYCEGEVYTTAGCIQPSFPATPTFTPTCCGSHTGGGGSGSTHTGSGGSGGTTTGTTGSVTYVESATCTPDGGLVVVTKSMNFHNGLFTGVS